MIHVYCIQMYKILLSVSTRFRVLIFLTERKDKETQLLNLQSVIICLGMGLSHAANEKPEKPL